MGLFLLAGVGIAPATAQRVSGYSIKGRVIDLTTRQGVPYAAVVVDTQPQRGVSTDSLGYFTLDRVEPGITALRISSVGYKPLLTPDYRISAATPFVEVALEEDATQVEAVTIRPTPFRFTAESPIGLQVIGVREIEKSPGANRDVSRIVRSYPGVAFSPVGYRNDLIVRGGGPAENKFFMDGVEIPNINHFATQGATGGPVGLVNADLVREISFYTGAFPAERTGALSSVLDFRLKAGNPEKQTFKATLGASEVGISGSGHIGRKTTYLFSVRQSYLQLLFKLLGLPFLPNYIDGQVKIRSRLSERDEVTFLGLVGVDNMRLNTDQKGEEAEYLLSYLPRIWQETFTVGATWQHQVGNHTQRLSLSHSYLNNRNLKYRNNDASTEENLLLRLRGVEQKSTLRFEQRSLLGRWTLRAGAEVAYQHFDNRSHQRLYVAGTEQTIAYQTRLGIVSYGLFCSADYISPNQRFTASLGLRADGSDYSAYVARPWHQLSPRGSVRYSLSERWSLSGSAGLYYQLPPLTALGYRLDGKFVNHALRYLRVWQTNAGVEWRLRERLAVTLTGFYKGYGDIPLSLVDAIPLACKGNDYGVVGNEPLRSEAEGRAYGVEVLARWQIPGKIHLVGSFTYYRSEYNRGRATAYLPSAWDNRWLLNVSGSWDLPRNWCVGVRLSAIGGAPYTPYDEDKSSLVEAWDAQGRPYYDYSRYNSGRLEAFAQLDLRVDKVFYFRKWLLGLYVDLQNVTMSKLRQPDVLFATGEILNPEAPPSEQRYQMKRIEQVGGTLVPTLGVTIEF